MNLRRLPFHSVLLVMPLTYTTSIKAHNGAIQQESIPSWWVVLAIVLRESGNSHGPCQQLSRLSVRPRQTGAKKSTPAKRSIQKRCVQKTIKKKRSGPRSQRMQADQRRAALKSIMRAAAQGPPIPKPKQPRTTYQQSVAPDDAQQMPLALAPSRCPSSLTNSPRQLDLPQCPLADHEHSVG